MDWPGSSLSSNTPASKNLPASSPELAVRTLFSCQFSYPSGHLDINRGVNDSTDNSYNFAHGGLCSDRSLYDDLSYSKKTGRVGAEDELVPLEHVDILSDGVYLTTASPDSFIGVLLSPVGGRTAFAKNCLSAQADGPTSQPHPTSTPEPLSQPYTSSFTLRETQNANQPVNLDFHSYRHVPDSVSRGLKALPAALPGAAYNVGASGSLRTTERTTKETSKTSVKAYSSLREGRKGGDQSPAHDFAVVIVERESSGESTDHGTNDECASIESSKESIAAKAANIIRDWKMESNTLEQQRLELKAYAQREIDSGPACFRAAWKRDLLLRDCQNQIQAKLQSK